jgi:antitoxin (DNA-binding transcriptional repressor) of toxin-antitoxin stability system
MMEVMAVHLTEAELARDLHAVLEQVRQGAEVVVESDHQPVARISPVRGPGRPVDECIAIAQTLGSNVPLDDQFGADLEQIIAQRKAVDSPAWD